MSTILLIHGAWLTASSWDHIKARYEAAGHRCLAPPWPCVEGPVDAVRRSPDPELGHTSLRRLVSHYDHLVRGLPEPPIFVGHSFGGLVVQRLLDRGLGVAGIAFASPAPRGAQADVGTYRTALPVLARGWSGLYMPTFDRFVRRIGNGLPRGEQRVFYEREIVPAPARLFYELTLGLHTGVDWFAAGRAPLLLVAGERDRVVPEPTARATARRYQGGSSIVDLRVVPDRSHMLIFEPGWERLVDDALLWATSQRELRLGPETPPSEERPRP